MHNTDRMKISDIEVKDAVFEVLKDTTLVTDVISGRLYKDARPQNSTKEDIVIAVVAGDASQIQEFRINVNVFVPDVRRGNEYIEDTQRLRVISSLCIEALDDKFLGGFIIKLESQRIMAVNGASIHAVNNSLNVRYCTENY